MERPLVPDNCIARLTLNPAFRRQFEESAPPRGLSTSHEVAAMVNVVVLGAVQAMLLGFTRMVKVISPD
jgi:hypothetical protein